MWIMNNYDKILNSARIKQKNCDDSIQNKLSKWAASDTNLYIIKIAMEKNFRNVFRRFIRSLKKILYQRNWKKIFRDGNVAFVK